MAKNKYYAVRVGKVPGIYQSWEECKKVIDGFSNAEYRGFSNKQDALAYLNNKNITNSHMEKTYEMNSVIAYVDGSYSDQLKKYSYGCIIIKDNKVVKKLYGNGDNIEYLYMRNVAGELMGAMKAIKWAIENKYSQIIIYYDYQGIESWANGSWKTNKKGTKEYLEFIQKYSNFIKITFNKVKAHSGIEYNEQADKLAKQALMHNQGNNSFNKERKLFNTIMNKQSKAKNQINIIFGNYSINERKLKRFVEEIWKFSGSNKSEISSININLDIKNSRIDWNITDNNGISYEDEFIIY